MKCSCGLGDILSIDAAVVGAATATATAATTGKAAGTAERAAAKYVHPVSVMCSTN